MAEATPHDPSIPPGWTYNPATWGERLPIVGLALVGAAIATYLALYQYGVTDSVWEPFFKVSDDPERNQTEAILSSTLSYPFTRVLGWDWMPFPITDAALGAVAYFLDAAAGVYGGTRRWRRMPWVVVLFAILVGPLGLVSIFLLIAQPLIEGHWCTLCLCSAAVSAAMIPPAIDEALASLQYIKRAHDDPNRSFWRAFWGVEASGKVNFW